MTRVPRTTLVLAGIAALLGAYLLIFERERPSMDEARRRDRELVPGFDADAARRLRIARADAGEILLEREPSGRGDEGRWVLRQAGAAHPADAAAVNELLRLLEILEIDRDADLAPETAGLSPPRAVLDVEGGGGGVTLSIGRADPSGRGLYVSRAGTSRVLVVSRRLGELVDREAGAFRDRRLIAPAALAGTQRISWTTPGTPGPRTLELSAGQWKNEAGLRVARERVEASLRTLATLTATRFVGLPGADSDTSGRALQLATPEPWTLSIGEVGQGGCGADARVAVRGLGEVRDALCLTAADVDRLWDALATAASRDLRLVAARPAEVAAVTLSDGARRLVLRRDAGGWSITQPAVPYRADAETVDELLQTLADTRLAPGAPPGVAARWLVLEGEARERLSVSAPSAGSVRVEREGERAPASGPASLHALFDPEPLRFRHRTVLSFARADVTGVVLHSPSGEVRAARQPDGSSWQLAAPAGARLDEQALDRLLATFTNLKAERFLPPGEAPPFDPDRTIEVREEVPGEPGQGTARRAHRLELARSGGLSAGGCLARVAGDRQLFSLGAAACADLRRPLLASPK